VSGVFTHWPNRITAIRFVGALVLFVLFATWGTGAGPLVVEPGWMTQATFWLFVIIALTDYLDGYLARRTGTVSAFGRIADPFVDKVLVLGTMIFLTVMPWSRPWFPTWIVVIVLAREFLVTGIRSYVESLGMSFAADRLGKLKMVAQCLAIGFALGCYAFPWTVIGIQTEWLSACTHGLVWLTLISSVHSGWNYVVKASAMIAEAKP